MKLLQYAAVASGIGFSSLLFETALTRLAAFIVYQDFVFFAISTAVCGIGIGAAISSLFKNGLKEENLLIKGPIFLAGLIMASLILIPILPSNDAYKMWVFFALGSIPPFIMHGIILSRIYTEHHDKAAILYAVDLIGASTGALISVPLINAIAPVHTIVFSALFLLLLSLCVAKNNKPFLRKNIPLFAASIIIFVVTAFFTSSKYYDNLLLSRDVPGKGLFLELKNGSGEIHSTVWNAMGRIDVTTNSLELPCRFIYTDGSIPATEYGYNVDSTKINNHLLRFVGFAPFISGSTDSVLSIGTGAGLDCHLFRLGKGQSLTAIELNPALVNHVKENSYYNGSVYKTAGVSIKIDEGRRFIQSTSQRFDIIMLLLAQGNHAEAGGRVLSESYLMTTEAFSQYYDHLKPGGRIAIAVHNAHRASRYIMTWAEMLKRKGYSLPESIRRTALLAYPDNAYRFLLLFWRDLPDSTTVTNLKLFADSTPSNAIYIPYIWEEDRDLGGMAKGIISAEMFIRTSPNGIPIGAISDNKPFQNDVFSGIHPILSKILKFVATILILLSIAMVFQNQHRLAARNLPFFILIGTGYMGYEVLLLHRLMLHLGHPTLSLSIVITFLLAASGCAGFIVSKNGHIPLFAKKLIFILPIWIFFTLPIIDNSMNFLIHLSDPFRWLAASLLTIVPGFGMGFFMPHALAALGKRGQENSIAWLYGINGISSVIGALMVMSIATLYGLQIALGVIALIYLSAILMLHKTSTN